MILAQISIETMTLWKQLVDQGIAWEVSIIQLRTELDLKGEEMNPLYFSFEAALWRN